MSEALSFEPKLCVSCSELQTTSSLLQSKSAVKFPFVSAQLHHHHRDRIGRRLSRGLFRWALVLMPSWIGLEQQRLRPCPLLLPLDCVDEHPTTSLVPFGQRRAA